MLRTEPVVFVLHDTYHIMVQTTEDSLMWVKVGDEVYYDAWNGVIRSMTRVHRMIVPREELDLACQYTICERKIVERKAYYTETEVEKETTFQFRPVKGGNLRCYHISDAHNKEDEPIAAAKAYGKIDFLIMNGDIVSSNDEIKDFDSIYRIAYEVTKGEIPIVFSRGNHDLRGKYAEILAEYTPNENGNTYYTFRLGNIWGMVLDCGEDKDDCRPEYGNTICCHSFRKKETEFIKRVIAQKEYMDDGIVWKVIIVHIPFTVVKTSIFDIERDIFTEWAKLLKENVKPDIMICGHEHKLRVIEPEGEGDELGHPCPIIIGAKVSHSDTFFAGTGIEFSDKKITATFTDNQGREEKWEINYGKDTSYGFKCWAGKTS